MGVGKHWAAIGEELRSKCGISCGRSLLSFRDLVEDKAGWEEAMDKDMMDIFGNPPEPLDDPVEDERGWEEALDRDLMDRFVNPPAHLSE